MAEEPYVLALITPEAWNALCERNPELAFRLEAGLIGPEVSDAQLLAMLVFSGVPVQRPDAA